MASIINGYIKLDQFKKIDRNKIIRGEKGDRIPITISVNDESRYGNNCDIFIQQSVEERQAKSGRHYIGNASVIWTDGNVTKGQKEGNNSGAPKPPFPIADQKPAGDIDDLPF
jgi:hypothetical protein